MTDQELIYAYASGTTDQFRTKVIMQSERFVVFRTAGHTDWSGVGMRSYYASHTVLIRKGDWCLKGDRTEWYGRIGKKVVKEALDTAEKTNKVIVQTFGDFERGAEKK